MILKGIPSVLVDTVAKIFAFKGPFDESKFFDFIQVLRNGGLGQTDFVYQIIADAPLLPADVFQDGHTCWVGQYFCYGSDLIVFFGEDMCFGYPHIKLYIAILR